MTIRTFLLISLLLAVALAHPRHEDFDMVSPFVRSAKTWQLRALRRAEMRLKELEERLATVGGTSCAERDAEIEAAKDALDKARACLYRGIGYREYSRLRALCKDRSEIRDELSSYIGMCKEKEVGTEMQICFSTKVDPLKTKLKAAFEACRTIGWKGEGRVERDGCPNIMTLKKKLEELQSIECGGARRVKRINEKIRKTKKRIAYLLGLINPKPSAAPRLM